MHNVTVMMSTYNGEQYLREQLDSVIAQENVTVSIFVRDDGSTDGTHEILEEYRINEGINWCFGNNIGPANSFFELLKNVPESDYYAFCDQDDIWDSDKLFSAITILEGSLKKHAIYCCGTRIVDKDLTPIRTHRLDIRRSLMTRMMLANISGNTIVMNHSLRVKLSQYLPQNTVMHDAWCVKVAICVGADVFIDPAPHISYRQHANNAVGIEISISDRIRKFKYIITEKNIYKQLMEIKKAYSDEMLPEYEHVLQLVEGNNHSLCKRIKLILRKDINFYNFFLNVAFNLKILTKNFK